MTTEPPAESPPDPATPERRVELSRMMLAWAIQSYEIACHRWTEVHAAYPRLPVPQWPRDVDEHRRWTRLLREADDDFDAAELALAQRINNLYDELAPLGRRTDDEGSDWFVPRAVRHQGTVYVLTYSVNEHEPKTNIIACYREAVTLDLDGG